VSVEIPLAGIAAIRLVAAAGAGGMAVTAWALRRAGMPAPVIACRMVAAVLVVAVLSLALLPRDLEQRLERLASSPRALGRLARRLAKAPDTLGSGVRTAGELVRERRLGLFGAVAYWGFDIAVLGVCFHAFGSVVPVAVLVMGYFLGTLGSLLPLPGGIGGVEGGMIGAFVAFGVPAGSALIGGPGLPRDLILAPYAARHRRLSCASLYRPQVAMGRRQESQHTVAPGTEIRLGRMTNRSS
jgi:uncharacterized membrane protein YbhN (UPF0104 family)